MFKRLIGLSALLSLSLLATAASAGPRPARLDKVDQVGRPVSVERFRQTAPRAAGRAVRSETRTQKAAPPAKLQRVQIRTDVVVGQAGRGVTRSGVDTAIVSSRAPAQNPVASRMAQRARCEDASSCGSASRVRAETRMSNPNAQRDGVSEMRRKLRNERLYRMIMGKIMQKAHPGK